MILLAHSYFLRDDPKQLARMKPYPPLSTLLAGSLLRERGHEPAFFDAMLAPDLESFGAALDGCRPSIVGILEDNFNFLTKMCTLRMREATLEMIRMARERGCAVAVNGSDSSDRAALYLAVGADAVILGEGEIAFAELAEVWSRNRSAEIDQIAGLALPGRNGAVRFTAPRPGISDLDALPLPAWDLVDADAYREVWTRAHGRTSWNMATSRGCPFGCNWCAKPIFGRRYAQRSAEAVALEMRRLKDDIAPEHIWFADDIFGLTGEWIHAFAAEVARLGARTPFMIQSRCNLMRPAVAAALAEAGAEEVWMGIESGSQKVLDAMEKGTRVEDARTATRTLRSNGIRACWFIQLGYPSESWDDLIRTRDLIREEEPDEIGVSVAYPLPGTKFHERVMLQLGSKRNWDDTDDLAMLFDGTYRTPFYRRVRDLLHREASTRTPDARSWAALEEVEESFRTAEPLTLAAEG
jgi:anaerobic magnesium-protoporphyrin IX monomethyl ester cyclase